MASLSRDVIKSLMLSISAFFSCCRHFNELESSLKEETWDALLHGTV